MRSLESAMDRAYRAYFRRFGQRADQPNAALSDIEDGPPRVVVLANVRGELARYRIHPKTGALRFVEPVFPDPNE
jgi:hypothetical protein